MEDVELYWLQFYVLILETERCLYNIQMLVLTRNFLIIFLVIQLQFKKKKVAGPNVRPRVQTGLITVIYSNSAFYTSDYVHSLSSASYQQKW